MTDQTRPMDQPLITHVGRGEQDGDVVAFLSARATRPGGQPVPGPLRFSLAAHHLEHLAHVLP